MGQAFSHYDHTIVVANDTDLTPHQSMMIIPYLSEFGKILERKWFLGILEFNGE